MRKHNYVVGFEGEGQVAYGADTKDGRSQWINLMTLHKAKRRLTDLYAGKKTIYKLVPIRVVKK